MNEKHVMGFAKTVSLCTGLSRALGFVREILMAGAFGTSLAQSAFVVAFRIPNLFRRLFGEGALSAAFVPVFTDSLVKDGRPAAWSLAGRMMTMLGMLLVLLVGAGIAIATLCLTTADLSLKAELVLSLMRIMLPYMFFICLVALCMAILNSFKHFLLPAATPVVLNIVWIGTLLFISPRFGDSPQLRIYGVAWGILAAGLVQLLMQVPLLMRYGFRWRLPVDWFDDARVHRVLVLMGPAALGMGITQVNVFIDTMLALWIGPWAPAALSFAERLIYLPLGVFATALGTVLLPVFSEQVSESRPDALKRTLNRSLRTLLMVMIPAATGLLVLAHPVVRTVFERGEFTALSTLLTSRALRCYAPGLVVFSLYKVFVPAFYAMHDTRTPVRVGAVMVGVNFAMNLTFILTLPEYYKHAGLALATVIAGALNAVTLAVLLTRRIGSPGWIQIAFSALRSAGASVVMAVAAVGCYRWAAAWLPDGTGSRVLSLLLAIGVGVLVYAALALVLCRAEVKELRRSASGSDR